MEKYVSASVSLGDFEDMFNMYWIHIDVYSRFKAISQMCKEILLILVFSCWLGDHLEALCLKVKRIMMYVVMGTPRGLENLMSKIYDHENNWINE